MGEEKKELGERLCGEMTRADDLTGVSAGARLSGDLGRFFPFGARLFDHTHTHREDGTGVVVCTHPLARAARLGEKGDGVIGQYLVFFFPLRVYTTHTHTRPIKSGGGLERVASVAFSPMACVCWLLPLGKGEKGDFGQSQGPMNARTLAEGARTCVCVCWLYVQPLHLLVWYTRFCAPSTT